MTREATATAEKATGDTDPHECFVGSPEYLENARRMLGAMLTYCRPDGSASEAEFIKHYVDNLPGITCDGFGNRRVIINNPGDTAPRILWSCHTDTVHRLAGPGSQRIEDHGPGITYCLPANSESACLGGDNTVGVWLLRHMILAQVPGLYIFHVDGGAAGTATGKFAIVK